MRVCMYKCMNKCVYKCVYIYVYACMYLCIYLCKVSPNCIEYSLLSMKILLLLYSI